MKDKHYVSDKNYYPGKQAIDAGSVFTLDQWVKCGGSEDSLKEHVKRGYIKEVSLKSPEELGLSVQPKGEESVNEVVVEDKPKVKASGVWNFDRDQLGSMSVEVLNTVYRTRAKEYGLDVQDRPFNDKEALIDIMCKEA